MSSGDILLVLGIVLMAFSVTSAMAAYVYDRLSRLALAGVLLGGGMIGWAWLTWPGPFGADSVALAFTRALATVLGW